MSRPKVISTRSLYSGPVFGVRRDVVIEPGGLRVSRDVVTHSGSVVILPALRDGRILLIRQYRHAVGRFLWELVAGRIEPHESDHSAARRELSEETGYTARRYRKLLDLFPTPGFATENMVIFLAEDITAGTPHPEADERIMSRAFSLPALLRSIRRGTLRDAKSVSAILYYARFIRHA
jgi:ADP-ribose pyrophosphatase